MFTTHPQINIQKRCFESPPQNCLLNNTTTHPVVHSKNLRLILDSSLSPTPILHQQNLSTCSSEEVSDPLLSTASTSCLNHSHRLLTSLLPPLSLPGSLAFSCSLTTPSSFLLQNLGACGARGLECSYPQIVS